MTIANAQLTSMLKRLSDSIINQTIGSSDQINTAGPWNSASGFLVLYKVATKSVQTIQNLKFLADPPHKIWE